MTSAMATAAPADAPDPVEPPVDAAFDPDVDPDVDAAPDHRLVAEAATTVADPPAGMADSFLLHAALELGARLDLLPYVRPAGREQARERIREVRATYGAVATVRAPTDGPRPEDALDALVIAIDAGDVDGADAAATVLVATNTHADVATSVADVFLPRLSGAGHAVIALDRLHRIGPADPVGAAGLRLQARQAAEHPDWTLTWHRSLARPVPSTNVPSLVDVLLAPLAPGPRGSDFIFPMLHLVESSGLAADVLTAPLTAVADHEAASRDLLRVAAWSMLQDDPASAPYGWTHCLTLPLGALGMSGRGADPRDALAVAATYVLAFRSTQGAVALDPHWAPSEAVNPAAAAIWHASEEQLPDRIADLCTYAAGHPDAHLVKYTEACLRATALDPEAGRLYLAAATHLAAWWQAIEDPSTVTA